MNRPVVQLGWLLIPLILATVGFALSPVARAADGGLPNNNTAEGTGALNTLSTGKSNTAMGFNALFNNSSGNNNTATGVQALLNNMTGTGNTATGLNALNRNTNGAANTATGVGTLFFNTGGTNNTAEGFEALEKNTTGNDNTASGVNALFNNMNGQSNTAIGEGALFKNTSGGSNTAVGDNALMNCTGNENIGIGDVAGENLTTGSNNIDIGNTGVALDSFTMRLGAAQNATYIAGISGVAVTGAPVVVSTTGQVGVAPSSARFKEAIQPIDKVSESILALKPVTFRYKKDLDRDGIPQFGLVAEDVEKVNPDLVTSDQQGKPFTVRYEAVNAMLLNEFLKEHRQVQEQQKQIDKLTAMLQKVSAQVELMKALPRTVTEKD